MTVQINSKDTLVDLISLYGYYYKWSSKTFRAHMNPFASGNSICICEKRGKNRIATGSRTLWKRICNNNQCMFSYRYLYIYRLELYFLCNNSIKIKLVFSCDSCLEAQSSSNVLAINEIRLWQQCLPSALHNAINYDWAFT